MRKFFWTYYKKQTNTKHEMPPSNCVVYF